MSETFSVPAPALGGVGLRLAYGTHVVVPAADIALAAGRVTALVGPNGSGKSTLLRSLAHLHRLDAGTISLPGVSDARTLPAKAYARLVTLLAQQHPTPGGVTAREVVAFGRHPHRGRFGGDEAGPDAIARAMELTGVTTMAERAVDELSGGELQRVWLAACLAQDTGVLLLDEPTTYLDLRYQVELLDLVRDLAARGVAVGIVLHDLNQAAAVADTVVLLDHGRVRATGAPDDVLTSDLLSEVYGVDVDVYRHPLTGRTCCEPRRRHAPALA